jgi:peptidase E
MAKQKKTIAKNVKTGIFVIGSAGFGKISAVEGIRTTSAMKKRAGDARAKGLTAEEYRRTIIRSYHKD